ncbi:MAG TPA: tetratricopeptide repeat protein, partial [Candidatus Krumholzibacteria bacterium]|nr:tetratricopeptide repeat protein [Candidatus Krumholzibacteria bacterium]
MKIRARRRISELLVAVLLVFLLPGTSRAEDDPNDSSQSKDASAQTPKTLTELGIQFEFASALTGAARKGAINSLEQPLQSVLQSDLDDAEKAAATFLFAEMEGELNRPSKARELFEKAAKEDKRGPFVDDAEFAAIRALEAEGQNEEALKQWKKWEEGHPHSPLLAQAWIARAWNELRQSKWDQAKKTLDQLKSIAPWTSGMQRVVVARATLLYAQGDPAACLSELAKAPAHSAAVSYLKALCYDEQAEVLHAAAAYQEVYERYPDSPLRYLG